MDTSGLVLFGRSRDAVRNLHGQFREGGVHKVYEALVCGHRFIEEGEEGGFTIDNELCRDAEHPPWMVTSTEKSRARNLMAIEEGQGNEKWHRMLRKNKRAVTEVSVIKREFFGEQQLPVTRVRLIPKTGRTHQLRVHLAGLGCPIIGDDLYGVKGIGCRYGGIGEVSERYSP